jgi:hypothetical protein
VCACGCRGSFLISGPLVAYVGNSRARGKGTREDGQDGQDGEDSEDSQRIACARRGSKASVGGVKWGKNRGKTSSRSKSRRPLYSLPSLRILMYACVCVCVCVGRRMCRGRVCMGRGWRAFTRKYKSCAVILRNKWIYGVRKNGGPGEDGSSLGQFLRRWNVGLCEGKRTSRKRGGG